MPPAKNWLQRKMRNELEIKALCGLLNSNCQEAYSEHVG